MSLSSPTAALLAAGLTAAAATTAVFALPATASTAKATITFPTAGATVTGNGVTVRGNYNASASVREVRVAFCKLSTTGACTSYLSNAAAGTWVTPYRSLPANLTPSSQVAGTFALPGTNFSPGSYKVAAFLVTNDTPKGPPMQVTFTVRAGEPPQQPTNGFITIGFGRAQWSAATGDNCNVVPAGARTLEQNLADLASRGLKATGGVIINRTEPAERTCYQQQLLQPSWADLTRLRDNYGFTAVSQGMNYADMTKMSTDAQRFAESGATVPIFNNKGFTKAHSMFNYPNNKMDAAANRVVSQNFLFGRKYGTSVNTRAEVMTYPYLVKTISVMGGKCNNRALACYSMPVKNDKRTVPPSRLANILKPKANQWGAIQFYRIVEGAYGRMGGKDIAWDCTSSDWRNRWTSHPEMYCRNSFLEAIDGRSKTATNADPAQVANAWGRSLD